MPEKGTMVFTGFYSFEGRKDSFSAMVNSPACSNSANKCSRRDFSFRWIFNGIHFRSQLIRQEVRRTPATKKGFVHIPSNIFCGLREKAIDLWGWP